MRKLGGAEVLIEEPRPVVDVANASIRETMKALQTNSTNLIVAVSSDMRVVGVISDGDIRRALLAGSSMDHPIAGIIRKDPVVVKERESRAVVLDLMQARGIAAIPIVGDSGEYRGLHLLRQLLGRMPRANTAVLMAGGRGSRLLPADSPIPKPMVKVAGRPILERLVNHIVGYGIQDLVITTGFRAEVIESYFAEGERHGCRIRYIREDSEAGRGTAGALSEVRTLLGPEPLPMLVMNGDLVTQINLSDLLACHSQSGAVVTIATHFHSYQVPFGVIRGDRNGVVHKVLEKPSHQELVSSGIYVLDPSVLPHVPDTGQFHMTDLIDKCLADGRHVGYWQSDEDWIDVGRPSDLAAARGLET